MLRFLMKMRGQVDLVMDIWDKLRLSESFLCDTTLKYISSYIYNGRSPSSNFIAWCVLSLTAGTGSTAVQASRPVRLPQPQDHFPDSHL